MKIWLAAGLIVALSFNAAGGKYCVENGSSDGIEYKIVSSDCGHRDESLLIHQQFLYFRDIIFNEYGLHIPAMQNVTIACGASIFTGLTGRDAKTAGIYFPERAEFIFQRPSALKRKGILDQTLQHELFHSALTAAREGAGISDKKRTLYIEESLATALYPAGAYDLAKGKGILEKLNDEKKIKNYLDQFLFSANEKERSEAYAAAYVYGSSLIKSIGRQKAFRRAAGIDD